MRLGPHPVHPRPGLRRAVRVTFFRLFQDDKIFRGKRLVNWDTHLRTAVADDEIKYEDVQGHLWTIKYPVAGSESGEALHVATTRPETMLGDTAVAVHPDDPRFRHLIGKSVTLPLTGRTIPIIADPILVDPKFGTGCVKVTPAHDPNDYQTGLRHNLPMINLLNPDGTYNENAGAYAGLHGKEVRKRVVADLEAQGLLEKVEPYANRVGTLRPEQDADRAVSLRPVVRPHGRRSPSGRWTPSPRAGSRSTPSDTPGAISTGSARSATGASAGSSGGATASRSGTATTMTEDDLRPRLRRPPRRRLATAPRPAAGSICAEDDLATPTAARLPGGRTLEQDPDVLDTWFSSALWPHSTLGWPEETPELAKYYPTSVLSTARDIITLWVARMVIFGLFNRERRPLPRRLHPPRDPGRRGASDVEVGGQRHRPGRHHRPLRRRRPAVHPGLGGHRDAGPADARREGQAARRPRWSTPPTGSSRAGPSPTSSGTPRGSP